MQKLPDVPDPEVVNLFHLNSDRDSGPGALHHTLGLGSSQASPGNHRHNGRDSYRIDYADIKNAPNISPPVAVDYQPQGGTNGAQPVFSEPGITGMYLKHGDLVHFEIQVDFSNITDFGTGQYYLTLPLPAKVPYLFRNGCLHDDSQNRQYHISGHVAAGDTQVWLFTTDRQGNRIFDDPFTNNSPVSLSAADNFHVAGSYIV